MYSNLAQTERYDEHVMQKSRSFQDAQYDALWVKMWLRRCLHQFGDCLVIWGQRLQTFRTAPES